MAKGIKSKTRIVANANAASLESGSNKIFTEVDMDTARNATIIVNFTLSDTQYMLDFHVGTFIDNGVPTSGTAVAVSDTCTIVQDTANSTATTTITSNKCDISATGIYIYNVHNLSRFANVQYTGTGTGSSATVNIIGVDMEQAPYATSEAAY